MMQLKKIKLTLTAFLLVGVFHSTAQNELWHIPLDIADDATPMILAEVGSVLGYVVAIDQACAQLMADTDEYCINTDWDDICQANYNDCVYEPDCDGVDAFWSLTYFPLPFNSATELSYGCPEIGGLTVFANQECAQYVASTLPDCANNFWDATCWSTYNCCLGVEGCGDSDACNYDPKLCPNPDLCEYEQIYIPVDPNTGPAIISCERPNDYVLADLECAQFIMALNPQWFQTSWSAYHFQYVCCVNAGCVDENACNYDEDACPSQFGVCVYGGCTYEDADNYDPLAACDDGSCTYTNVGNSCPSDLNGDFIVTAADLSIFLAAFGTPCP